MHLLFSTRDANKASDTLERLSAHLRKTLRDANGKTLGISRLLEARVKLLGVSLDLLKLTTVKALAEELLASGQRIDAVVWNAGIAGWAGQNWPKSVWMTMTDLIHATTFPTYMITDVGLATRPQLPAKDTNGDNDRAPEPKLGQVFTANVFGHYMLTHWLRPLMHADTRIVWVSSISALSHTFSLDDIQGLSSEATYEGSKRLTDLLVLTSELPSTKPYMENFLPPSQDSAHSRPKMYVTHPGVIGTSIAGLHWFVGLFMFAAFYMARWLGSPWHLADPYKGAVSAAFAILASRPQLPEQEERDGKGKWGSAVTVYGDERVARTEVEGWGFCGKPGVVPQGSVTGKTGRYRGFRETTKEAREEFEETGRQAWKELEEMRTEWEARLGPLSHKAPASQ